MKSPGAPSLRREIERQFWREIAAGLIPREAAEAVGVSQAAGSRWFRHGGGMPTVELTPLSGRYLSFAEREEIAILTRAGRWASGRSLGRLGRAPSTISARAAPQRGHPRRACSSIGRRSRSGRPSWLLGDRRQRSSSPNERLRDYVQDRLAGRSTVPMGPRWPGRRRSWKGRNKPHRGDRRWATAWSPEQISQPAQGRLPR